MFIQRSPRPFGSASAAVIVTVALGACAGPAEDQAATGEGTPTSSPSASASGDSVDRRSKSPKPERTSKAPTGPVLEVTVKGATVSPNAREISLGVGDPLTINFTVDRAGELHVHSKPEQFVAFPQGTSTQRLTITTPGTVEIEEHDTGVVVAVVEVS